MFNKEGKCNICGEPGKRIAYTVSGNIWYACEKHENEVVGISAEHHRDKEIKKVKEFTRIRNLLDTNPKNFMQL